MKDEFVEFLNALMAAAPEVVEEKMTDAIQSYLNALIDTDNKPVLTDNGKVIMRYLQSVDARMRKAKDIGDEVMLSSRAVSGALRKLVSDGFVEKMGSNPVVYMITSKGQEFKIED